MKLKFGSGGRKWENAIDLKTNGEDRLSARLSKSCDSVSADLVGEVAKQPPRAVGVHVLPSVEHVEHL